MKKESGTIEEVVNAFAKLPGIGKKSAHRITYYLLKTSREEVSEFAHKLLALKDKVGYCSRCFNFAEEDLCSFCSNPERDTSLLCVVEEPKDIDSIEKTHSFHGLYHVLGGVLAPLDGITPEKLKINELMERIKNENIKEIIIALNPSTEGDTTTHYLAKLIKPMEKKITRLARGIPVGGDLEFSDEMTITRALEGRVEL